MVLATVALGLVVGAVFVTLLLTIEAARNAERRARHAQDVLIAANGLELRVLDLETGQRGFILTHQMQFLLPWQQALAALPQEGRALLKLVAGDRAQEARVREILAAARSYINDYSVPLVNAAAKNDPAARTVAATAEGDARVQIIRGDFAQLLEAERRTSAATARASTDAVHRAYAGAVVGIGASHYSGGALCRLPDASDRQADSTCRNPDGPCRRRRPRRTAARDWHGRDRRAAAGL